MNERKGGGRREVRNSANERNREREREERREGEDYKQSFTGL